MDNCLVVLQMNEDRSGIKRKIIESSFEGYGPIFIIGAKKESSSKSECFSDVTCFIKKLMTQIEVKRRSNAT